jgi:PAS domain S-box-containing protein
MTQREHKRFDVPFRIQVLVPSFLCLAALFAGLFWVAVPFVHDQLYSAKRDMICEMTETVWYLLQQYHLRVQSGEVPRADSQSRAIERVRSMRYGPESLNYFWIVDLSGTVMLNPTNSQLEGNSGLDIVDVNGKRLVEEMIRIANEEEDGLLEYYWPRPDRPDLPIQKLSYVRLFEPWGWIIGTGVYKEDIDAQVDRIIWRLQMVFLGCLLSLTGLAVWMALLSRRIERRRRDAEQRLAASERQHRTSLENMLCGFVLMELITDDSGKAVDARVIQVNPAALRITGMPVDPTDRRMSDLFPATVAERMTEIDEIIHTRLPLRDEKFLSEFGRWLEVLAFSPQPNHFAITFTDITERKIAEEKIAKELSLRQMLIDQLPCAAMILKNGTREIVSCNEIARKMGAVPGKDCYTTFGGRDDPCSFCMAPTVWESGRSQKIEVEHHKGGWCECIWIPLSEDLYVHYIFNITERKTAEQALRESEQRRRVLIETTATGYIAIDKQGRVMDANPEYVRLTGHHGLEEVRGRSVLEWTAEYEIAKNTEAIAQCLRDGYIRNFEVDYVDPQGKITPIEVNATVEGTGDTQVILTLCRDITERRRAEQALKASELQLRLIVENATDMISSHAPDSTIRYVSPSCRTLLGFEPEELLGRKAADFIHPDDIAMTWEVIQSAVRFRKPGYQVEHRGLRKNGEYIWVEDHAHLLYDEAGELTEIQCSVRDITERRRNEESLRILNSRHQAILMAIPDIVAEVDVTHRYTWLNPAGLAFFGDGAVGRYAHDYFIGEQATYRNVQSLFNGDDETIYIESWQRRKDGKRRLLGWWCRPLKDALGRVIGALSTARDITEAQLAQRQREQLLASLETKNDELQSVLYTASHDLRSPLVNIQGFGGELERACGKLRELLASPDCNFDSRREIETLLTDAVPECLHFVRAGADKIQMLLDGLLRLSRVGSLEITLEPLNMNELLGKVLHAQRFQIQQRLAEVAVDPLPACVGDVVMVNQLFGNLIDNALKYSDPSRPCRIRITGQIVDSHAVYAVADNGIGIEPEHRQEIFQIFYRLHPGGAVPGEGLGLAIVKRIMDRLNGTVHVESVPGQGTTFSLTLPRPDTGD